MMQAPSPTLLIAAANTYIGWNEDTEQQHFARRSALVERVLDEMHVALSDGAPVKQQFVRTGIVLRLGDFVTSYRGTRYREIETIEANTNERRDEEGGMVLKQLRRLSSEMGDKFVRWAELDVRAERVAGFIKQGAAAGERRERVIENVVEAVLEAMVDETPEEQAA
jgi:hypothetical protein